MLAQMKNNFLINSRFSIQFLVKVMETVNHLQHWLLTKYKDNTIIMFKKT